MKVRVLHEDDYEQWQPLFRGYRQFYQQADNKDAEDQTWEWLMNPDESVQGIVCEDDSHEIKGFMHFEQHTSTLTAKKSGFLNDIFVAEDARGAGVFEALFEELKAIGQNQEWDNIQWRTAENNYRARKAYDRISAPTGFLTYRLPLK